VKNYEGDKSKIKISEKELEDKISVENSRASNYEQKIKKYSCEGELVIKNNIDHPYKTDIKYTSQLDDQNQHLVTLSLGEMSVYSQIFFSDALSAVLTGYSMFSKKPEDQEAPDVAKKVFSQYTVKCGDFIYARDNLKSGIGCYLRFKWENVTYDPGHSGASPPNEYERQNGMQWDGWIGLNISPCQEYCVGGAGKKSDDYLETGGITININMKKKNGEWSNQYFGTSSNNYDHTQITPPTCEEVLIPNGKPPAAQP
jgi:hypothetical protein